MSQLAAKPILDVAVGLLCNAQGQIFVATRQAGSLYAGLTEFPGGKCEPGESVYAALVRELREEIGVEVLSAAPLLTTWFHEQAVLVRLHFWLLGAYRGEPQGREGQTTWFMDIADLATATFPPANRPLIEYLLARETLFAEFSLDAV